MSWCSSSGLPRIAGLLCAVLAACSPAGRSVSWPTEATDEHIGFLVSLNENGQLNEPILGPLDLTEDGPVFTQSAGASTFLVAVERTALRDFERRIDAEGTIALEARSRGLEACEDGIYGETDLERPLGEEAVVFRLADDGFEPATTASIDELVSWRIETATRCARKFSTSVAPFATTADVIPAELGMLREREVVSVVPLGPDLVVLVSESWMVAVERGRSPDPAWRMSASRLPDITSTGYGFSAAARLPTRGDELGRLAIAGTIGDRGENENGWFVAELSVEPGAFRFERWIHRAMNLDAAAAETILIDEQGNLITGTNGQLLFAAAAAATSTTWSMPGVDIRSAVLTPMLPAPHAFGSDVNQIWFGDAEEGPTSFRSEQPDPGESIGIVESILATEHGFYALTNRSLTRRVSAGLWETLPLEIPTQATLCAVPRVNEPCGHLRLPVGFMKTAASARGGVLIAASTCDALFFRHPGGCVDAVPLMSAPEILPGKSHVREVRAIVELGDRWLVGATPGSLFELTIETD